MAISSADVTPRTLRELLRNLVDYAGLFPPAKLDMATTVRNHASWLDGPDAWMLGRLIIPVGRLSEFESVAGACLPDRGGDDPWFLSALCAPAGSDGLRADLECVLAFNERHGSAEAGAAIIDQIELVGAEPAAIDDALDLIPDELFPFFELPVMKADTRGHIAVLAGSDAGAKIRTGGMTADLFPSAGQVARFILDVARAEVPFKATAGLHHPLPNLDPHAKCPAHGFLGVLAASLLAHGGEEDPARLVDVLCLADPHRFEFGDEDAVIAGRSIHADAIDAMRMSLMNSFGSCSFDEPRADLRAMAMLPPADHDR